MINIQHVWGNIENVDKQREENEMGWFDALPFWLKQSWDFVRWTGAWLKTQQRLLFLFLLAGSRASGHSAFCFGRALGQSFLSTQPKPGNEAITSRQRKRKCFSWLSEEVAPW